jgi:PhnB protein
MRLNSTKKPLAQRSHAGLTCPTEKSPTANSKSPAALGGSPVILHLYVPDADAVFSDAIKAGAKEIMPLGNQFWGDRAGQVVDPFGHIWHIATHVEDVDPSEFQSRMEACFAGKSA